MECLAGCRADVWTARGTYVQSAECSVQSAECSSGLRCRPIRCRSHFAVQPAAAAQFVPDLRDTEPDGATPSGGPLITGTQAPISAYQCPSVPTSAHHRRTPSPSNVEGTKSVLDGKTFPRHCHPPDSTSRAEEKKGNIVSKQCGVSSGHGLPSPQHTVTPLTSKARPPGPGRHVIQNESRDTCQVLHSYARHPSHSMLYIDRVRNRGG